MASGDWLRGFGFGLGAMYYFDPDLGKRRRALVRDKLVATIHRLDDAIEVGLRDATNRLQGFWAEGRAMLVHEAVTDDQLCARVRSRLGRCVSRPSSIEVTAHEGRVILRGPVLAHEAGRLLEAVRSVRGVRGVENHLDVHQRGEDAPGLQGEAGRGGERSALIETNWAPATRLLGGTIGAGLMANCWQRPTPLNVTLGTLGWAVFMRAVTDKPASEFFGLAESIPRADFRASRPAGAAASSEALAKQSS